MQSLPENVAPCHHTASNVLQVSHVLCSHLQIAVNDIMIHFMLCSSSDNEDGGSGNGDNEDGGSGNGDNDDGGSGNDDRGWGLG